MPSNRYFFRILLFAVTFLACTSGLSAQISPDSGKEGAHQYSLPETDSLRVKALDAVLRHYNNWETVEMTGKLRASGLPLNPTVKLYMARGSEISISVRAPFVGEAGRIEICGDTLTAINRMKRVYCKESLSGILSGYPGFVSDLQSLLLGRIVVLGSGELSFVNAALMDVSVSEASTFGGNPGWRFEQQGLGELVSGLSLAYVATSAGRLSDLELNMAVPQKDDDGENASRDISVGLRYSYPDSGLDISIVKGKGNLMNEVAMLDFNSIKWKADRPAPVKLGDRFRQVSIKDFFRSF